MNTGDLGHDFGINLFFVAYFLFTNVVMLNIVVAGPCTLYPAPYALHPAPCTMNALMCPHISA